MRTRTHACPRFLAGYLLVGRSDSRMRKIRLSEPATEESAESDSVSPVSCTTDVSKDIGFAATSAFPGSRRRASLRDSPDMQLPDTASAVGALVARRAPTRTCRYPCAVAQVRVREAFRVRHGPGGGTAAPSGGDRSSSANLAVRAVGVGQKGGGWRDATFGDRRGRMAALRWRANAHAGTWLGQSERGEPDRMMVSKSAMEGEHFELSALTLGDLARTPVSRSNSGVSLPPSWRGPIKIWARARLSVASVILVGSFRRSTSEIHVLARPNPGAARSFWLANPFPLPCNSTPSS